ncbi:hypothetical protein EJ05DRAFT_537597 [Pseudovirgaria hyperparasitica]|uniref:INSIG domain-containing protein n=1 Tax=Pseudovirgaria hyperparasitica TaxID=470096 RepID=A0A6A6WBG4_9PEZI|nr:uncharacterized protein EJ05DRAFT_537597 [Pseudovirgaria hyperparasitica]KAF2759300.1 hypothetical protein EJ05DRAFT_537597 [Pseudovirgaria hyperparasitica]
MDEPQLFRPQPRRPFKTSIDTLGNPSSSSQQDSFAAQLDERLRRSRGSSINDSDSRAPSRNRSFLNLTGSTLFGIYSGNGGDGEQSESATPWGTGAETPATPVKWEGFRIPTPSLPSFPSRGISLDGTRRGNYTRPKSFPVMVAEILSRTAALFVIGLAYGIIVAHVHEHGQLQIAPVRVEELDHGSLKNLLAWGFASVIVGMLFPLVDTMWNTSQGSNLTASDKLKLLRREEEDRLRNGGMFAQVVRAVGIFVGLAFAIRKLPWRSTLQVSVTLSMVNPVLWYIIDRTSPGFVISTILALSGTCTLLLTNPGVVPASSSAQDHVTFANGTSQALGQSDLIAGALSYEFVGVATWVSSVIFCSCIGFGNIGRALAGKR